MANLKELYIQWRGTEPAKMEKIEGSGSNREYYRLYDADGHTVIGVIGTSRDEDHAFIYLSRHFEQRKLPVPHVLAVSEDEMCYLQTDLGNTSLFDAIKGGRMAGGRYNEHEKDLLRRTIRELPNIQLRGARGLDWTNCYPQPAFDEESVLFDLNYFKYCFLKPSQLDFHELKLEANFHLFAKDLVSEQGESFLYRDFQARNVMLCDGAPYFIDFQGGMQGPLQYDIASFLWQASARYPQTLREQLIDAYLAELQQIVPQLNSNAFRHRLQQFVLFRILQVLGAYGLRGYFERKKYFLDSIPLAIQNLRRLLLEGAATPYPCLNDTLHRMVELPQFNQKPEELGQATKSKYDGQGPLVVRVFSFSYKKGIPEDTSGNGGGYVFDCRSTHNPGRYEQYKPLTGLDAPVIKFLEDDGEILTFLDSVYKLADAHVTRYMERGFTNLMFSFGCTGGRHRSVYSAQHLAEHIHQKFGIEVHICHREQGISDTLNATK